MYKCVHHRQTKLIDSYFTSLSSIHDHATHKSAKGDLYVSQINTTQYGKRTAIKCAGPILWNSLPTTIRDSLSLNIFKKRFLFFIVSGIIGLLFEIEFSLQLLSLRSVGLDNGWCPVAGCWRAFQYEVHISL